MADGSWQPDDSEAFRAVWAIRDALATRMHAEMLFDLAAEMLGESAWIETSDETMRMLGTHHFAATSVERNESGVEVPSGGTCPWPPPVSRQIHRR